MRLLCDWANSATVISRSGDLPRGKRNPSSMTDEVKRKAKAWESALWMAYIRPVDIDGRREWAVFDGDGEIVHHSENRSAAFFFASSYEVTVVMLN